MASLDTPDDCHQKLNCYLSVLSDVKSNYESIFSWDIYEKTKICRDKKTVVFEKVTRKLELSFDTKNVFDLTNMCLRLINCFEIFLNGEFSEAICVIKSLIQSLKNTEIDEFFKSISDVCFHILKATQAYIMAFLDEDVQKILKSIKPVSTFNIVELAAIRGIKSKIFLEYPPGGNSIALDLAKTARILNDVEMYWTSIWLKAQGRKRKFDNKYNLAFRDEFRFANKLGDGNNPEILLCTAKFFLEAGFAFRAFLENVVLSFEYYRKAMDLVTKAYTLSSDNLKILCHCLSILSDFPPHFFMYDKVMVNQIAMKISCQTQNYKINEALGKYNLYISKNFTEAKNHLVKASSNKIFSASIHLLRAESELKFNFSVISYLKSLLEIYTDSPKKRLIIISQILLYYVYVCNENNEEQLLHYLDKYLNENINNAYKKYYIYQAIPFYEFPVHRKLIKLFDSLKVNIDKFKTYPHWSSENKNTLESVIAKFSTICDRDRKAEYVEMDLTCVICFEKNTACVLFEPCHHKCICKCCWDILSVDYERVCPMCRSPVISISIFEETRG